MIMKNIAKVLFINNNRETDKKKNSFRVYTISNF